ncbi:MAG TPA: isochorismatase family protein [Solirubrobacterales bacterium]|nr:isochorismatase family protein [Solirubrobacterales bacterium]
MYENVVCLAQTALSASTDDYEVYFVSDASGGVTEEAHEDAKRRMEATGANVKEPTEAEAAGRVTRRPAPKCSMKTARLTRRIRPWRQRRTRPVDDAAGENRSRDGQTGEAAGCPASKASHRPRSQERGRLRGRRNRRR